MKEELQDWIHINIPNEKLIYADAALHQALFMRDTISQLVFKTYKIYCEHPIQVIGIYTSDFAKLCQSCEKGEDCGVHVVSTHHSKSVTLPVYQILSVEGIEYILRYNFYNWMISVNSPFEIDIDFKGLFDLDNNISKCYCEGFPTGTVYTCYNENKSRFTIELTHVYQVYTFFWLISKFLETREVHGIPTI